MIDCATEKFRVLIFHAYSSQNRGDGLLVEETVELLKTSLGNGLEIRVIAMDAATFSSTSGLTFLQLPISATGLTLSQRLRILVRAVNNRGSLGFSEWNPIGWIRDNASGGMIVAVGGGYLRSSSPIQSLKFFLAHGLQLREAARSGVSCVYMPQSVGPFRSLFGWWLRAQARKLSHLAVRDDRSFSDLRVRSGSVVRLPDLAVLRIAEGFPFIKLVPAPAASRYVLIFRELTGSPARVSSYLARCRELIGLLGQTSCVLGIQSTGRGNDDAAFYTTVNLGPAALPVKEALSQNPGSVVISVRLHGALQSILDGHPTIHLSYERKGFGAYEDLGVPEYVHNSFAFSPNFVALQASTLRSNSAAFWEQISAARQKLTRSRDTLVEIVRSTKEAA